MRSAYVRDAKNLYQELGELIGAGAEGLGLFQHCGVVFEEVGVEDTDHGCAGAGRGHDVGVAVEDGDEAFGEVAGFGLEAGVEGGLAAAGLGLGEGELDALVPEHLDHGLADLGVELVD